MIILWTAAAAGLGIWYIRSKVSLFLLTTAVEDIIALSSSIMTMLLKLNRFFHYWFFIYYNRKGEGRLYKWTVIKVNWKLDDSICVLKLDYFDIRQEQQQSQLVSSFPGDGVWAPLCTSLLGLDWKYGMKNLNN
jgi:hypothetical protein